MGNFSFNIRNIFHFSFQIIYNGTSQAVIRTRVTEATAQNKERENDTIRKDKVKFHWEGKNNEKKKGRQI